MYEVESLIQSLQNDLFQYVNIECEIKRINRIATEQNETREQLKTRIANSEQQILTILKKKYESNI